MIELKKASLFALFLSFLALNSLDDLAQANPYFNAGEVPPKPDTNPPTIIIHSPANNSAYYGNNFTVTLDFSVTQPTGPTVDHPSIDEISYCTDWHPSNISLYARNEWDPYGGFFNTTYSQEISFTGIAEGKHNITVYATYHGRYIPGNDNHTLSLNTFTISGKSTVYFTADDLKIPRLWAVSVENKTFNQTDVPLVFRCYGPVSQMVYSLDGNANVSVAGNTTLTGLPYGMHTLTAYPVDTLCHQGEPKTVKFHVIDVYPPEIEILSIEKDSVYNSSTLALNFTIDESPSQLSYTLDGQPNATITGNITLTGLTNGHHNITVYALDGTGTMGASKTVFFDVKAPESAVTIILVLAIMTISVFAGSILFIFKRRSVKTAF